MDAASGSQECLSATDVTDYLTGVYPAEVRERVRAHLDTCDVCRALVAAVAADASGSEVAPSTETGAGGPPPSQWAPAEKVGRYQLLEPLGAGGMGVVYAAYHPELDRKVALKRVRAVTQLHSPREASRRLLREARAMARLAHPNVLSVFDAFSNDEEEVFIVMELVEGANFAEWLREGGHRSEQVLEILRAAGRGLAAAHEAGITHNDFKPSNVLIGAQGRTCVSDFGLSSHVPLSSLAPTVASSQLGQSLVGGTPAYMAPEQEQTREPSSFSDQYAFCLTAWDALLGPRPAGTPALAHGFPPPVDGVRAHVRRALERGLSPAPADRFPSMQALLAALERDPVRARLRALGAAAGVAAVLAGAVAWVQLSAGREQRRCAEPVARLDAVWNPSVELQLGNRLSALARPPGSELWRSVAQRLNRQAQQWRQLRQDACLARAPVRAACLEHWLTQLSTLTSLYAQGDAATVDAALPAAWGLGRVEACADPAVTLADEAAAGSRLAEWSALRARLVLPQTLANLRQSGPALRQAQALLPAVRAFGVPALTAELQLLLGRLFLAQGDQPRAVAACEEAVELALSGGRDDLAIQGMTALVSVRAQQSGGETEADRWTRLATALLGRQPTDNGQLRARLYVAVAARLVSQRRPAEALAPLREGLALVRGAADREPLLEAELLRALAQALRSTGKTGEARRAARESLDAQVALWGPGHPSVAAALSRAAEVEQDAGSHEAALALRRRAAEVLGAAYGEADPRVAAALFEQALAHARLEQREEGLKLARRSLAVLQQAAPAEQQALIPEVEPLKVQVLIAQLLLGLSRVEEAAQELARAAAQLAEKKREETAPHAQLLEAQAALRLARCDLPGARALLAQAVQVEERLYGRDGPQLGDVLTAQGLLELRARRPAEAARALERALAVRGAQGDPLEVAGTQFALARALHATGADPRRARTLAEEALARYAGRAEREQAQVQRWLVDRSEPSPGGACP